MTRALFICAALCASVASGQTVRYVWTNSPSPDGQFLTWETAARDIQSAIDIAAPGDVIIVTNGVYDRGGVRDWPPGTTLTNRVAIYKPVTVRSVNGPSNTVIAGRWHVPGDTNDIYGSNAVRCVYMTNGAVLAGFTLTNGATLSYLSSNESAFSCRGGGAYCHGTNVVITNCLIIGNRARMSGGGVNGGVVYNCTVMGNSLFVPPPWTWIEHGGGVAGAVVYNSLLTRNYSPYAGAGAQGCRLYNCVVLDNTCAGRGGGVDMSIVFDSLIVSNKANGGGGAYFGWGLGLIYNSTLIGNSSGNNGGAVAVGDWTSGWQEGGPAIFNSLIVGNYAVQNGGGVYGSGYLYNCTVTGNSNGQGGDGAAAE